MLAEDALARHALAWGADAGSGAAEFPDYGRFRFRSFADFFGHLNDPINGPQPSLFNQQYSAVSGVPADVVVPGWLILVLLLRALASPIILMATVVLAARGYPGAVEGGAEIGGLEALPGSGDEDRRARVLIDLAAALRSAGQRLESVDEYRRAYAAAKSGLSSMATS